MNYLSSISFLREAPGSREAFDALKVIQAVDTVNTAHANPQNVSPEDLKTFFLSVPFFKKWNEKMHEMPISDQLNEPHSPFSNEDFYSRYGTHTLLPLIVSPIKAGVNFVQWAGNHQQKIAKAIAEFGAVLFRGFELEKHEFPEAFEAATGTAPEACRGNTPRPGVEGVDGHVSQSTVVPDRHTIPFHNEVSAEGLENTPAIISFMCVKPPKEGSGHTLLGRNKDITDAVKTSDLDFWRHCREHTLTYTVRYLPSSGLRTRWIKYWNSSHTTIMEQFETEDRREIQDICSCKGLTCTWDGEWAVVTRTGVPATIERDGCTLFFNQIHLNKLNPALCGGWINYFFARLLLYPTSRSMQFDVQFDDGSETSLSTASRIYRVIQGDAVGLDWKTSDILFVDNVTTMHGKSAHKGDREIIVAMGGVGKF